MALTSRNSVHIVHTKTTFCLIVMGIFILSQLLVDDIFGEELAKYDKIYTQLDNLSEKIDNLSMNELGFVKVQFISICNEIHDLQSGLNDSSKSDIEKYNELISKFEYTGNKFDNLSSRYYSDSISLEQKILFMDIKKIINQLESNHQKFLIVKHNDQFSKNEVKTVHYKKYIDDVITEVIAEKTFLQEKINWPEIFKSTFQKIKEDRELNAFPLTIDRIMLQYTDEEILQLLLEARNDIQNYLNQNSIVYNDNLDTIAEVSSEDSSDDDMGEESFREQNISPELLSQIDSTVTMISVSLDAHETARQQTIVNSLMSISSSKSGSTVSSGGHSDVGRDRGPNNSLD